VIGLLIFATIADLLVAVVLVTVSGFIFGGQEGLGGEPSAVLMWSLSLVVCLAAPIGGFVLRGRQLAGAGAIVAWLPAVVALVLAFA